MSTEGSAQVRLASAQLDVAMGAVRYVAVAIVGLLLLSLLTGFGPSGFAWANVQATLFAVAWVGWIYVPLGLPPTISFLVVLYVVFPKVARPTRPIAVVLSAAIWAAFGLVLVAFSVATHSYQPGSPPTLDNSLVGMLMMVGIGAILGLVEGVRGPIGRGRTPGTQPLE